jgi:hypothetical protein
MVYNSLDNDLASGRIFKDELLLTIQDDILNIYEEQKLDRHLSMRKIGNSELSTKPTNYNNLDLISSVSYRVTKI